MPLSLEELRVPIRLIRVAESSRSDDHFRTVVEQASGLWVQAGIKLVLDDAAVIQLPENDELYEAMLELGVEGSEAITKYLRLLWGLLLERHNEGSVLVCAARYPKVQDVGTAGSRASLEFSW